MKLFLLITIITFVTSQNIDDDIRRIFNVTEDDFLKNYEEVTPPPLEDFGSLLKCEEGDQANKFFCVPYHNCNSDTKTIIEIGSLDGARVIDIRFGNDNQSKCDHFLDVCCQVPPGVNITELIASKTTSQPTLVSSTPATTRSTTIRSSARTRTTTIRTPVSTPPTNTGIRNTRTYCGIRNPNGLGFKITGNVNNEAEFGEFPWMVAILKTRYNPSSVEPLAVCGGSLIGARVVLTGAHCVNRLNRNDIKIRAGEWDTQTTREFIPYQERNISKIIIHENYKEDTLYNDVALLILDRNLVRADNIGPICLPTQNQNFNSRNCFATGWGKKNFGKEQEYSVILKKIQLPLVQHDDCQRALKRTRLGPIFRLHKSFTCAGGQPGIDTCTGDGGGPLVCQDPENPSRYLQVGMVAWGIGCGENQVPGVYVDVSKFRQWIDQQFEKERINTNSYIE